MKISLCAILICFLLIKFNSFSQTTKVLFIGNSLTGYFDQPTIFSQLAFASGKDVESFNAIKYGASIEYLSTNSITLNHIARNDWDYIVLQGSDYSIAFPEYHETMYPAYNTLKDYIRENCPLARIIFLWTGQ